LPGADDNDKMYRVLKNGPKWLLWHTHADSSAGFADLKVPNIRGMRRFARGHFLLRTLPEGPFEQRVGHADKTKSAAAKRPKRDAPVSGRTKHERIVPESVEIGAAGAIG